jgi:hypothetical protein
VVEYPKVFDHVGLLVNEPPALPGCPSSSHPTASRQLPIGPDVDLKGAPMMGLVYGSERQKQGGPEKAEKVRLTAALLQAPEDLQSALEPVRLRFRQ